MHFKSIELKLPKVRLSDQVRASSFTCQNFMSFKIVVHILFAVKGVFPKDLEAMLSLLGLIKL